MTEQKLEYVYRLDYSPAIEAGVRWGRIAAIFILIDLALTLASMSFYSLLGQIDLGYNAERDIVSILNLGEIFSAAIFFLLLVVFLASGITSVKRAPGTGSLAQVACISAVSGLVTGAMATTALLVSIVAIRLYSMPQTGYVTMFTQFTPAGIFDVLLWAPIIALIAAVSGICYAGFTRTLKNVS